MLKFEQCFTTPLWLISLLMLFSVLLSVMDRLTLEETNLALLLWNVHQSVVQRGIYLLMSQYENIQPSTDLCAVAARGNQQVCLHWKYKLISVSYSLVICNDVNVRTGNECELTWRCTELWDIVGRLNLCCWLECQEFLNQQVELNSKLHSSNTHLKSYIYVFWVAF